MCLLPARPDVEREIRRLVDRVRANGRATRVLRLPKIDRRDSFGAPLRAEAHAAVERGAQALEEFESEAYARDAQPTADAGMNRSIPEAT